MMDAKAFTKIVLIIVAALFLFETETAAIIIAAYDTVKGTPVPQQTLGFISAGIVYAAGVLGIHTFSRNGNGGDKNA